ncbi:conjugal transfer protein (plasmid) [Kribbella sp. CA-253562]|uniref:conjugal transfer protein n=1 Tax=Kribbella sp. CA-253562 TaxID=3239942 RepID=UPI003D903DF7
MSVVRKVLAMPPREEHADSEAAAPAVEVYLEEPHPRMEIAGKTYPLEGADVDTRRANARQQVLEWARTIDQPVLVNVEEHLGSAALTFYPDGTIEAVVEPLEEQSAREAGTPAKAHAGPARELGHAFPVVEERKASPAAKVLRYLLLLLVILLCVTGVRAIIWPYGFGRSGPVTTGGALSSFPAAEASQVAARFTTSYLTWDERNRDSRASAISLDLVQGLDATAGWSGEGVQSVAAVYPGAVKTDNDHEGHVVVLARVIPFKGSGQTWKAQPAIWQRLSVPIEVGPARVVVSGAPAYVPEGPAIGRENASGPAATDEALTATTQSDARAFFSAYATSDEATSAITAPGSGIRSLNKAVELESLKTWTVDAGDGDRRTAQATVTWKLPGGTTRLTQNYALILIRSTAADGMQRWQVAEITNN